MHSKKDKLRNSLSLFLIIFLPAGMLIAGLAVWYIHEQERIVIERHRVEAIHHVEGQANRVRRFYKQGIIMLLALARDRSLHAALAGSVSVRRDVASVFSDVMRFSDIYEQIRLLDSSGREIVRVERTQENIHVVPAAELQNKGKRAYVRRTLELPDRGVYVSPFDLNMEHGKVERPYKAMVRVATPIMGDHGINNAVLVINILGINIMQRELPETVLEGEHLLLNAGSTYWFDRHASQLHVLENRNEVTLQHRLSRDWGHIFNEEKGQAMVAEGQFTFAALYPVSFNGLPQSIVQPRWRIVSFVPATALLAAAGKGNFQVWAACATSIILLGMIVWLWSRHRTLQRIAGQQRDMLLSSNQRLAQGLIQAREDERTRLARVLHDDISQTLAFIQMRAEAVISHCSGKNDSAVLSSMRVIQDTAAGMIKTVRGQLKQLRPPQLDELGLKMSLGSLCEQWQRANSVSCRMRISKAVETLTGSVQINLYRIVQEALTNVARHASASRVYLSLGIRDDGIRLTIRDDGHGFDPDVETTGIGLSGMRERVQLLGGSMRVESAPGRGARLIFYIPP